MTAQPTEALTTDARPVLRIVPAPTSAPPYDDEPGRAPVLRLVAPLVREPEPLDDAAWVGAERTPCADLPGVTVVAHTLIQGVLEVLAGVRSVKQLRRDTTPEVYAALAESLAHRPRPRGTRPTRRAVRSLHVQERPEGIAEVCATVQRGSRLIAVALRLEGIEGQWRCTDLVGL